MILHNYIYNLHALAQMKQTRDKQQSTASLWLAKSISYYQKKSYRDTIMFQDVHIEGLCD